MAIPGWRHGMNGLCVTRAVREDRPIACEKWRLVGSDTEMFEMFEVLLMIQKSGNHHLGWLKHVIHQ